MITDECAKLCALLSQVEHAKQNEQLVKKLKERNADIGAIRDKLRTSTSRLTPLRTRDTPLDDLPDASNAFTRISRLRETLANNPADITKGRDFTILCKACEKLIDEIDTVVSGAWPGFVERFRAKLDQAQLKQYETFSIHGKTVERIKALESESQRLQRKPPADEEAMTALEGKWEEIRKLVQELPAVDSDPEIQAFIDASNSREGASLGLLSPKVRDWLANQQMTDNFRVIHHS